MKRRGFLAASLASGAAAWGLHAPRSTSQPLYQTHSARPAWHDANIFLQGINAPVFAEVDAENLTVTGTVPLDLTGMYVRNGANPMFQPIAYQYPLEGDGMLHALYLQAGKARYRNRWIQTRGLLYEMQAGRSLPEQKLRNYANTNLIAHAGQLLALYETGLPYRITPDLETIGEWNFGGAIDQAMTAHPRLDPHTGELHFYRYSFFNEPYLTYSVADAQGRVIRQAAIDLPRPALLHDMAVTDRYAIFFQCPLVFDLQEAMRCGTPFVWQPQHGTRIGLIHRHDLQRDPIWIETEPFWAWHFMNAYEENGRVVIDFVYYPEISTQNTLAAVLSNQSHLRRAIVDVETRTIAQQPLDDRIVEFPTIDTRRAGQPYRFGYAAHLNRAVIAQKGVPNYFSELIQYDTSSGTSKVHRLRSGCYGGEAAFVPKPNSAAESEGYVILWAFDENRQASDLVILDAANFEQEPIAQIHLPVRVPMGAHGSWIPQPS